ncbi:hypothetical protein N8I74_11065 [Chitiniphilus purpureus]|uniref:Uncharacterized protein n=1 Tax=Chitiniphilus purpureus TaxID=2981137 RepID=A0ABY6DIK3_9NEIS|nr:hypothetical protein [Chitiniphilus sp. CD1]UXY13862.1 hypothetical protein N8I74_11065 [Chitiniphilus sp. CD1]
MFDAALRRLNAAAARRLANGVATLQGRDVLGHFDAEYAEALDYASGRRPVFQCDAAALPALPFEGDAISIQSTGGVPLFTGVIRRVEPDGAGWLVLWLQEL